MLNVITVKSRMQKLNITKYFCVAKSVKMKLSKNIRVKNQVSFSCPLGYVIYVSGCLYVHHSKLYNSNLCQLLI